MMNKAVPVDDSLNDFNINGNFTPFTDSVSSMEWMPASPSNPNPLNMIAVTTWDGSLRVYEVKQSGSIGYLHQVTCITAQNPINCCTWNSDTNTSITFATIDGGIHNVDLTTSNVNQIASCNDVISNIHYVPSSNCIVSIGYDKIINFWQANNQNAVYTHNTPSKIYVSDYANGILAAGTEEQKIMIYDVVNMNNFQKPTITQSYLQKKSQLSSMSLNNEATLVSYGSIDGRGNISSIKKSSGFNTLNTHSLASELIFKANRYDINGTHYVYPVNGIGFNMRNSKWIYTAASDGVIQFWNYQGRALIKSLNFLKVPVTHAKVNRAGDFIAYALGDDFHQGPQGEGKWQTKIACHYISDSEVRHTAKK